MLFEIFIFFISAISGLLSQPFQQILRPEWYGQGGVDNNFPGFGINMQQPAIPSPFHQQAYPLALPAAGYPPNMMPHLPLGPNYPAFMYPRDLDNNPATPYRRSLTSPSKDGANPGVASVNSNTNANN